MPESESEQREAQVNLTEATEGPNPISEEPRTSYAQEGKPRCINPSILNAIQIMFLLCICAFTFTGVDWNHRCIILGTQVPVTRN